MAYFKFSNEAKQIFIDTYNDPEVPWNELSKVITTKLIEEGHLQEGQKITAKLCRVALENKLGLLYKNRPRVKYETAISFEDEDENEDGNENENEENSTTVQSNVEVEEVEEEPTTDSNFDSDSTYTAHQKEPSKFKF